MLQLYIACVLINYTTHRHEQVSMATFTIIIIRLVWEPLKKSSQNSNSQKLKVHTLGSSGGSYCTIQSTAGMSSPLAATSVHNKIPDSALQNWKNVVVRFVCCCLPWNKFDINIKLKLSACIWLHWREQWYRCGWKATIFIFLLRALMIKLELVSYPWSAFFLEVF